MSTDEINMAKYDSSPTEEGARKAKKINQEMLRTLVAGLLEDPEADLMELIPPEYEQHFVRNNKEQSDVNELACELPQAALLGRRALTALLSEFASYPTLDLLGVFPDSYKIKRRHHMEEFEKAKKETKQPKPEETPEKDTKPANEIKWRPFFAPIESADASFFEALAPLSPAVSLPLERE